MIVKYQILNNIDIDTSSHAKPALHTPGNEVAVYSIRVTSTGPYPIQITAVNGIAFYIIIRRIVYSYAIFTIIN